ncbi:MAG: alpha-L-fucosidase [Candidatus Avoscillospira sp.]
MSDRMKWFRDARYGMFIHWGLYSQLAGYWNGVRYHSIAEWIMSYAKIPVKEYSQLMHSFNPVDFDAEKWVSYAKSFGVKYLCITAKHHEGFAMFDSKVTDYTIMHTPFGRDIVKELADACHRQGIVFCVYYSQKQDWYDPNGCGNTWDYDPEKQDFNIYFNNLVKPQVRELLENYGEVGMIWFDTPYDMPKPLCEELKAFVHSIQPNCLVSGRIGYNLGDFREMADNEYPVLPYRGAWETPITLNNTWGFAKDDHDWKSPDTIVKALADVVGKGGNLLVNVGPDARGNIPEESIRILSTVGDWLQKNGESIYGEETYIDYPYQIRWGALTAKGNKLYMHIVNLQEHRNHIMIWSLVTKVKRAYVLETGQEVSFRQWYEVARDENRLLIDLPENIQVNPACVIVLELEGKPVVRDIEGNPPAADQSQAAD